jgi:uncharacterized RDD family membrane protein YckC
MSLPAQPAPQPAPLLRRLLAATYDGLLFLGLLLGALLIEVLIRDVLLKLPANPRFLSAYVFIIGLLFYGWFWVHGGQTLGMRVWGLRVIRGNGTPLHWPAAILRYALMAVVWLVLFTPAIAGIDRIATQHPYSHIAAAVTLGLTVIGLILMQLDRERRAPHDWASGTRVIYHPT